MNPLFKTVNSILDGAARGLKAFGMTFQRGASFVLLPRTRVDYGRGVEQALGNSIIAGLIGWATRNFPEAPVRVQRKRITGKKIELEQIFESDAGPGFMLTLLENPNPFYSGTNLIKAALVDYITRANVYIVKLRNGSGRVMELWWLPEWLVEPKWPQDDPSVFISHYEYNPNGVPYRIEVEDMIHLRDGIDPRNTRKGLNRFASLFRELFTDDEAANFSAALLNNLGIPGVIISPQDSGVASRNRLDDPEGIRDKFNERFQGDGRGGAMVLTSPTDVKMLAFNPQQLTLKDLRRLPEERASSVVGIPAILAGLGAGLDRSTYANMKEAREAGYEEFIIPTQRDWGRELRKQLLVEFADPKDYLVDFDLSEVRVLSEDQNAIAERNLKMLLGGGITRRTFKENIGETADDKDDVYYIPANVDVVNAEEVPPALAADQPSEPNPLTLPPVEPGVAGGNGNGNGNRIPVTA